MFPIVEDMSTFESDLYANSVNTENWGTHRLPLSTVIINVNDGYYYVGFNSLAVNMIRKGAEVIGLGGIIHASMDNSTRLNVPYVVDVDWVMGDRHKVFRTKSMPNDFYDPTLPYLSVKRIIAPHMGRFIEEALNA